MPRFQVKALYILSVALVRRLLWTGVTRYGALWCPDFPRGGPFDGPSLASAQDTLRLLSAWLIQLSSKGFQPFSDSANLELRSIAARRSQLVLPSCAFLMGTIFQFPYRTVAEVNLRSLVKNLYTLRSQSGKEILPVLKADAYGHGMLPVAKALVNRGSCRMLLVATLEEALVLREQLPTVQILVLSGFFPHQLDAYLKFQIIPAIHSLTHLKSLLGRKELPEIHLKVDTGMNRLGIPLEEVSEAVKVVGGLPIKLAGISSHFAESEDASSKFTDKQVDAFNDVLDAFAEKKLLNTDVRIHIGNTAAALRGKLSRSNAIRPGLGLYGVPPSQTLPHAKDLVPILDWKTRIISLKSVPAGHSVGYGRTYSPKRKEKIAILGIGYADGYPRLLGNRAHVLVNGRKSPVRGRVSMDLIAVDVTTVPGVREGQAVTLIGSHGKHSLGAWDIARWAETIPYEIFCGLSPRVPRIYLD